MTRIQLLKTSEMRLLTEKIRIMTDRMLQSLDKIDETTGKEVEIDGWPSAIRGAKLIRTQFVKIIGEANLLDVTFDEVEQGKTRSKNGPTYSLVAEVNNDIERRRETKKKGTK